MMGLKGFYFITCRELAVESDVDNVCAAVAGGAKIIQYREKNLPFEFKKKNAEKMIEICEDKALFIINDDVDLAKSVGADGVHVGQDDMACVNAREVLGGKAILGVTVHDVAEAKKAAYDGANYLGASPIFSTTTKADAGKPSGTQLIRDIRRELDLPICAIGGINEWNIDEVLDAGADMVCAISATVAKKDVKGSVSFFSGKFR